MALVGQLPQCGDLACCGREDLAVDEKTLSGEQQTRFGIERDAMLVRVFIEGGPAERRVRRIEKNIRLGFGQVASGEFGDVAFAPFDFGDHVLDLAQHRAADFTGMGLQAQIGVGIAAFQRDRVLQMHQKAMCHFFGGGRAKTDRIGHAFVLGDAVMRDMRRQVEHVAGAEHPFVFRFETA